MSDKKLTELDESKQLLKAAHDRIEALQQENAALQTDLNSIIEAQALETEQMVQMSEQLWKLEDALMCETSDKEVALMMLQNLKTNVERIKSFAEDSLSSAKTKNASRLNLAVQVYEIKSMVDTLELDKKD